MEREKSSSQGDGGGVRGHKCEVISSILQLHIKFSLVVIATSSRRRSSLESELRLRQLDHDNIIKVHQVLVLLKLDILYVFQGACGGEKLCSYYHGIRG